MDGVPMSGNWHDGQGYRYAAACDERLTAGTAPTAAGGGCALCLGTEARAVQLDWLVDRLREWREGLWSLVVHIPAVFEPDTEFSRNVESGFVREAHPGFQRSLVAAHQIGRLVHVHADAMAGAMRQPWQEVILAPAETLVIGTHGFVDAAYRNADLCPLERYFLAALDSVPHLALAFRCVAEEPGARDIGLVAVHRAGTVDQDG